MKTIAIINLSPIGDVVNTSPVCVELKRNYKDVRLIYITIPNSKEIAFCIPGIDEVFVFDKRGKYKGLGILKWALSVRLKEKIDMAIVLNETFRSALLAFLLGAKKRIGRVSENRKFLLTDTIQHKQEEIDLQIHAREHYMRILKPVGLYNPSQDLALNYSVNDKEYVETLLSKYTNLSGNLIGLCPCTALDGKDLDPVETAKFIDFINKETDFKIVIIGISKAKIFVQKLNELGVNDFIDFTCQTNISQLLALIARFQILVSADSAPMHMGFALRVPTLGIFMNKVYEKWGPKNYDINNIIYKPGIVEGEVIIQEFIDFSKKVNKDSH